MHPINRLLKPFGLGIHRLPKSPDGFVRNYQACLQRLRQGSSKFRVIEEFYCDIGHHPVSYKEFECGFAASCLARVRPATVLDIGSYREFVLGVSAASQVTSLDVRSLPKISENETVVSADASGLPFKDAAFDVVTTLSSIEHFGLGRYGDEFDLEGDARALAEMKRCVRPGGLIVVTTTLTRTEPVLVFNGHRIYDLESIRGMMAPLTAIREAFYSHRLGRFCEAEEISDEPGVWDVYCGCWRRID